MPVKKISVLLSVHNDDQYVKVAIDSILNQSFTDFQFVIVDDASTDGTSKILNSYRDSRIEIIKNESNLGLTSSLNLAIRQAVTGLYIARIDSDDIADPTLLEELANYLDKHDSVGVVGSHKLFINQDGKALRTYEPPVDNPSIQQNQLSYNCIPHGGAMFRSVCVNEIGGYDETYRYGQDFDLILKITEQWDGANIGKILYKYRWHDKMISIAKRPEQNRSAEVIRNSAIRRRLNWGFARIVNKHNTIPEWMVAKSRSWIATRYTWWSMASRCTGNKYIPMKFLLLAMLSNPFIIDPWIYSVGIFLRKTRLNGPKAVQENL